MYFGEQIAFFFAWKSYITIVLFLLGLPGLFLQIYIFITDNYDSNLLIIWVLYTSIWSTFIVELWKRKNYEIIARWGMLEEEHNYDQ